MKLSKGLLVERKGEEREEVLTLGESIGFGILYLKLVQDVFEDQVVLF